MPEDKNSFSLVSVEDVAGLAKPCTTLIEKISSAFGGFFGPWQMKRMAKAEAEVAVIKTHQDLQVTDIKQRAMLRFEEEQAQYQRNMEQIVKKALPHVRDTAAPEKMDKDWLTYFFDKSRLVSDEEMQSVWARILAGEANEPESFSRRTMSLLSEMSKKDADMLVMLRRLCWDFDGSLLPVIPLNAMTCVENVVWSNGLDLHALNHLDSLGIISLRTRDGLHVPGNLNLCSYFGRRISFHKSDNGIALGCVALTPLGGEMLRLCEATPLEGVWEYVLDFWKTFSPEEII